MAKTGTDAANLQPGTSGGNTVLMSTVLTTVVGVGFLASLLLQLNSSIRALGEKGDTAKVQLLRRFRCIFSVTAVSVFLVGAIMVTDPTVENPLLWSYHVAVGAALQLWFCVLVGTTMYLAAPSVDLNGYAYTVTAAADEEQGCVAAAAEGSPE